MGFEKRFYPPVPSGLRVAEEDVSVVGVSFKKKACLRFAAGSALTLKLEREPTNEHDPNAVLVCGRFTEAGQRFQAKLGYLPKTLAAELARLNISVLPRLKRVWVDDPHDVSIQLDVLTLSRHSSQTELPKSLPAEEGTLREFTKETVSDDAQASEMLASLQIKTLSHDEQLDFVQRLANDLATESIGKLQEIQDFDAWELEEADADEVEELEDDCEPWLLELFKKDGFEELQETVSDALSILATSEGYLDEFLRRQVSWDLLVLGIVESIDELEQELVLEDEMIEIVRTPLKETLSILNRGISLIVGDDKTWRKNLAEKHEREAPARLAALEELQRAMDAGELEFVVEQHD